MKESEEKFRNLFNNAEVGMFRTRLDGSEVIDANERVLKILGRTREEVQGSPSVIHWADPSERAGNDPQSQYRWQCHRFPVQDAEKAGRGAGRCITSSRLYREQGILEGSIIDITERKQAEASARERDEGNDTVYS